MVGAIGSLVVIASAIWVAIDASRLGAKRGYLGGGLLDMGPVAWFFVVFLLWIVGLPAYLFTRPKYIQLQRTAAQPVPGYVSTMPTAVFRSSPAPGWYPDPVVPGGQRWWDGQQWAQQASQTPPGWYADPSVPGGQRWWDGYQWSPSLFSVGSRAEQYR